VTSLKHPHVGTQASCGKHAGHQSETAKLGADPKVWRR